MSLASISLVGNLVKDPEQFHFTSGRVKTTLIVAVNTFNKVRKERSADFYKVETWDKLAELSVTYLKRGNQIGVTGRLVMERWIDRDGRDRTTPTVHASQLALPQKRFSTGTRMDADEMESTSRSVASVFSDDDQSEEEKEEYAPSELQELVS